MSSAKKYTPLMFCILIQGRKVWLPNKGTTMQIPHWQAIDGASTKPFPEIQQQIMKEMKEGDYKLTITKPQQIGNIQLDFNSPNNASLKAMFDKKHIPDGSPGVDCYFYMAYIKIKESPLVKPEQLIYLDEAYTKCDKCEQNQLIKMYRMLLVMSKIAISQVDRQRDYDQKKVDKKLQQLEGESDDEDDMVDQNENLTTKKKATKKKVTKKKTSGKKGKGIKLKSTFDCASSLVEFAF